MRGGKYRFDYNRYDQVIHGLYSKQVYNHITSIEKEWRDTLYEPTVIRHEITANKLKTKNFMKGRAAKVILEQKIEIIHMAKLDFEENMFHFGKTEWEKSKELDR